MNKKIIFTVILSLIIIINLNSFQSLEIPDNEKYNINIKHDFNNSLPRIRLGFIAVNSDGTKDGSTVIVDAHDWNLREYFGRIVTFYIDYSIVNGGNNDYVNIEIDIIKNNSNWDNSSLKIANDYVTGEINFDNIQIKGGDTYVFNIKATYINKNPSIIIHDEDVSSLALSDYSLNMLFKILISLRYL